MRGHRDCRLAGNWYKNAPHSPAWLPNDNRDITRFVNRAALIDQIQQARATLEKLLTLLYQVPQGISANVRNRWKIRQIERCVISTFRIAESMGFKGDFRQWEELLRIGD